MVSACMRLRFVKTMGLQHEVQIRWGDGAESVRGGVGCCLEVAFIELDEAFRWIIGSHGSGFEDFVIERDREFFLRKAGTEGDLEFPSDDGCAGEGLAANGVDERLIADFDMQDDEATEKFEMIKRGEVHRGREDLGFECHSNLRDGLSTPSAERRMRFDGAYIREEAPAAFAFGVGADFDTCRQF